IKNIDTALKSNDDAQHMPNLANANDLNDVTIACSVQLTNHLKCLTVSSQTKLYSVHKMFNQVDVKQQILVCVGVCVCGCVCVGVCVCRGVCVCKTESFSNVRF